MSAPAFLTPSPLPINNSQRPRRLSAWSPTPRRFARSHNTTLATASGSSTETPSPAKETSTFSQRPDAPGWTGTGPLSRMVNALINFPPFKSVMRYGARKVLISTAERSGIEWTNEVAALNAALPLNSKQREQALSAVTNDDLVYPSYYTVPFHAYPKGNLDWLPAFEARPATMAMSKRVFEDESAEVAFDRMRKLFFEKLMKHAPGGWHAKPHLNVVDVGCSVGLSTRDLVSRIMNERGPQLAPPRVTGIDASPYFLAVAKRFQAEADAETTAPKAIVDYVHALAEGTGFPDESVDLWSMQLVTHELPDAATSAITAEAFRVLRSGGVFAIMDQDPRSEVIRNLPPVLATLMKSTEPYTDQYYLLDIEQVLLDTGFVQVRTELTTPRHRCFIAMKP
ncbi:putative methyltransferase sll0829 [Gracilariopsis chorda]|uniref:Putative methyltransferase sll0829 n=1 Tax=Gracilariopsis chorda TaxID=448386 RepID=A0A2V3IVA4_9FLOR|nr:putative methyltransferase sll0829 [Gracilariopsis chorda]|eukprot:PXF45070.1 putative methyltransferase sll0829 [Gracilariopsis chorda]